MLRINEFYEHYEGSGHVDRCTPEERKLRNRLIAEHNARHPDRKPLSLIGPEYEYTPEEMERIKNGFPRPKD